MVSKSHEAERHYRQALEFFQASAAADPANASNPMSVARRLVTILRKRYGSKRPSRSIAQARGRASRRLLAYRRAVAFDT